MCRSSYVYFCLSDRFRATNFKKHDPNLINEISYTKKFREMKRKAVKVYRVNIKDETNKATHFRRLVLETQRPGVA